MKDTDQEAHQDGDSHSQQHGQHAKIVVIEVVRRQQTDDDRAHCHTAFNRKVDAAHEDDKGLANGQDDQNRSLSGQVGQIDGAQEARVDKR